MGGISKEEEAVYDRQLRLWGVEAQRRLLRVKVLIWGLDGSNIELCKNLVLAGVSLHLRDHREVTNLDVAFNYFLRKTELGQKRAACMAVRLQEMNPLCAVTYDFQKPTIKDVASQLVWGTPPLSFDLVAVSFGVLGYSVETALFISTCCHEQGVYFMLSQAAGELGFFFIDLVVHRVKEQSSGSGGIGTTAQSTEAFSVEMRYPSFGEVLACDMSELHLRKNKVDPTVLLFILFFRFLRRRQEDGCSSWTRPEDALDFERFSSAACLREAYPCFFLEPLMPVAAVVGGLAAQEAIKAITQRDVPLMNCVCFSGSTGAAIVEQISGEASRYEAPAETDNTILD